MKKICKYCGGELGKGDTKKQHKNIQACIVNLRTRLDDFIFYENK